jgi:DNA-binding transcriptional regulator PaaX
MSFIKDLLSLINELGELIPEGKGNYRSLRQRLTGMDHATYYKSLNRLRQKKFIKQVKNKKSQTVYVITPAGRQALLKSLRRNPRQDGLATLITYDIPSDKNRERTKFRRYLLRNGFTLIQKSLLVSPNQFDDHLKNIIRELKLSRYVRVVSGKFDYIKFD